METQIKEKEIKITLKRILSGELMPIKIKNRTNSIINSKISSSSGIYFLFDKNKEFLYVGQSKNIKKRISEHISKNIGPPNSNVDANMIDSICYLITKDSIEKNILEALYIYIYNPPFNITKFNSLKRNKRKNICWEMSFEDAQKLAKEAREKTKKEIEKVAVDDPLMILKLKLANMEITPEEYEKRKKMLEE